MKTPLKIFFLMAVISLVAGCNKTDEFLGDNSAELKSAPIVNHDAPGLDQERWVTMKGMDLKVHYRIIGKGPIDVVFIPGWTNPVSYTHLRAHETVLDLVCRLLLEKKKK